MCTSLFEIITTLVCSLGFSCIQIPTKEIIMSPPSQPNNLTLKLYLRHCRPLNDSSLIILTSPGTVAEWAFIVDSNSKPQRLNDLPKGQWKLLLPGQSSVVNNFSRDPHERLRCFGNHSCEEGLSSQSWEFNVITVLMRYFSESDSSFAEVLLDCISDSFTKWQRLPTSPPHLAGYAWHSSFVSFFSLIFKTAAAFH